MCDENTCSLCAADRGLAFRDEQLLALPDERRFLYLVWEYRPDSAFRLIEEREQRQRGETD